MWLKTNFWWLVVVVVGLLVVWWVFWPMLKKDRTDPEVVELKQTVQKLEASVRLWRDSARYYKTREDQQHEITKYIERERIVYRRVYIDLSGDQLRRQLAADADSLRRQRQREDFEAGR